MKNIETLTSSTIGNLTIEPSILRHFLKKSTYFLNYDPKERTITFWANDGHGGQTIFEIQEASHESAEKIAKALGMKMDGSGQVSWSISNPHFTLNHDGSDDAEALRIELLRLDIPHEVFHSETLALNDGCTGIYMRSAGWTQPQMLDLIRKCAERWKTFCATP